MMGGKNQAIENVSVRNMQLEVQLYINFNTKRCLHYWFLSWCPLWLSFHSLNQVQVAYDAMASFNLKSSASDSPSQSLHLKVGSHKFRNKNRSNQGRCVTNFEANSGCDFSRSFWARCGTILVSERSPNPFQMKPSWFKNRSTLGC